MSVQLIERRSYKLRNKIKRWLFEGLRSTATKSKTHHEARWWNVMCLTGVDYFSTLGYQPGIAFLAAGMLSPMATFVLVLLTLFGALPVYREVAKESPHGQGSISMLERLLPGWRGKSLVLILLGFAATDFIITITLSAADATAHIVENPMVQQLQGVPFVHDKVVVTMVLLVLLGAIFLAGFREAIGVSVALVITYLVLNGVVLSVAAEHLMRAPEAFANWNTKIFQAHNSVIDMITASLLLFPKLALGMSGFETGVAVMPLVKGAADDAPDRPAVRIKSTQNMLFAAALIMAAFLMTSSIATTLLIPAEKFADGGDANGRAISYLAHEFLGHGFGTVYDISSILILWFAGASALAGLLTLVPRYLPRYGMAPEWAGAMRPLVIFFTLIAFVVTLLFKADVDAQAGAYATGVLVLMTSAALAVTLNFWKKSKTKAWVFLNITAVFIYTSAVNMHERPEGLHIASFFIGTILATSIISRAIRSLELRIQEVVLDPIALQFVKDSIRQTDQIDLLAHRPGGMDYRNKEEETRKVHRLTHSEAEFIFLEVAVSDASEFMGDCLEVKGIEVDGRKIFRCHSPAIPNAIAAIMMHLRDETGKIPHAYFGWTEGNPLAYVFKYIFLGEGETAPVTREILRELEKDPDKRPRIHVG